MSKHFEDARYYLGRAAEHAKAGVKEELEPVEARVKDLVGIVDDGEPEPSRLDRLQADLKETGGARGGRGPRGGGGGTRAHRRVSRPQRRQSGVGQPGRTRFAAFKPCRP